MKIKELKGKILCGFYDGDENPKPWFEIYSVEYFWGYFKIHGNIRGFVTTFTEDDFKELLGNGKVRVGKMTYYIKENTLKQLNINKL